MDRKYNICPCCGCATALPHSHPHALDVKFYVGSMGQCQCQFPRMWTKTEPLRIYVAGPYCPRGCDLHNASRIAQANVDRAIEVANQIIDKGHYAFVPHLSHYLHIHHSCKSDRGGWYYEFDNTFLDLWANALFLIAPSFGATAETERAVRLGHKVFFTMADVPVYSITH